MKKRNDFARQIWLTLKNQIQGPIREYALADPPTCEQDCHPAAFVNADKYGMVWVIEADYSAYVEADKTVVCTYTKVDGDWVQRWETILHNGKTVQQVLNDIAALTTKTQGE